MSEEEDRVVFGNWLSTSPTTIGGLSFIGWGGVVASVMLMVLCFTMGRFAEGGLALLLGLFFVAVFLVRWGPMDAGRTIASRLVGAFSQGSRNMAGESQYRTGVFSQLPVGQLSALPGALSKIEEIDGLDGLGEPYTLLHHTSTKQIAATFSCVPDGIDMHPQRAVNAQVANYGGWIASLSNDSAISGATVTVDSAYSSKAPLVAKLQNEVVEWAPEAAKLAHAQATEQLPGHFTDTTVHTTVVWDVRSLASTLDDAAAEVAARLVKHREALKAAGSGESVTATSEELARVVRTAYNPHRAVEFGTDDLLGHSNPMRLTEAGPDYFDDVRRRVAFHDGVASMTVEMVIPPRIHITEKTFRELFAPASNFLRKRVTVFYRPLSGGEGIQKAKQLRQGARTAATSKGMASSFDQQKVELAEKTEKDLTRGARMTAFALMVTVTFEPTEDAYRAAKTRLKDLLDSTDVTYRFVENGVSAAFHSTLPLGILPWQYQGVIDRVAEGL